MQSMDEIYRMHGQTIYRYLLTLTGDEHAAEELTQETFYQAIRSIDRFDGNCKVTTWLCGIAKNLFHAWQRKQWKTPEPLDETMPDYRSTEPAVLQRLEYLALLQQIHTMPELTREVMYLRLFGQLSFKEIGEVLGRTENWARVTYYRGKETLKKEMTKDEK
jgi:RNA polymerase sigma factor (sigma-70 family)